MSVWAFFAAIDGWMAAHCPEDGKSLSASEQDDLWNWLQGN